jgi:hypothetical protein
VRAGAKICRKYDAWYDTVTQEWLEGRCGDPECEFCANRPVTHPEDCTCDVEKKPLTNE